MSTGSRSLRVRPGGPLNGTLRVPGDKSISHRAVMLGALAEGRTEVLGFLPGEDCRATMRAFRALGVGIEELSAEHLIIEGVGLQGLAAPRGPLDVGNSGTSMRLLAGLLAGQPFDSELCGDASLSRRPMRRVADPLARMGARIDTSADGTPPLRIHGGRPLTGCDFELTVASAQVKSCLLLAGLYAGGSTCVREPAPSRDHTERMLEAFGYPLERAPGRVCVRGGGHLRGCGLRVPADLSSAAFFMVAASIVPGSRLVLREVGINPTRAGVVEILRRMGADIRYSHERMLGGEPVADIEVRHRPLQGIEVPASLVPLAIDEFPAVFVAAACAAGRTVISGAAELRVKETDRIAVMAEGLQALGIDARPTADGMTVTGGPIAAGAIDSRGDHRIAMAFAVAGLRGGGPVEVHDTANIETSFPGFASLAREAGMDLESLA